MPATPLEISRLWHHVNRQMHALLRRAGKDHDLPPFSFFLLRHIEEEPGTTLSELARRVGAAKSHTSTLVEHLVREGFVEKRSDPSDHRVVRLHATERARRLCAAMGDRAHRVWTMVLEEYDGDAEEVARFLHSLHAAVQRAHARMEREAGLAGPHSEPAEVSDP